MDLFTEFCKKNLVKTESNKDYLSTLRITKAFRASEEYKCLSKEVKRNLRKSYYIDKLKKTYGRYYYTDGNRHPISKNGNTLSNFKFLSEE